MMKRLTFMALLTAGMMASFCMTGCSQQTNKTQNEADSTAALSQVEEEVIAEDEAIVEEEPSVIEEEPSIVYGIDLGLSVNWAECNVGANSPEETGYEIPYGNTSGSIYYSAMTPANISNTSYDIAKKQMGDGWRMPTEAEMNELVSRCNMRPDTENGVAGVRITGANGNSIFLPACGSGKSPYWDDEEQNHTYKTAHPQTVGKQGHYWTGSESAASRRMIENARQNGMQTVGKADPAALMFNIERNERGITSESGKRNCFPVRAVHEK